MIFNSYAFLLLFLPGTLLAYGLASRFAVLRVETLILASLVFYGSWDPRLVPLLLASILFNWSLAYAFSRTGNGLCIGFAVACDLLLLGGLKYTNFLWLSLGDLFGHAPTPLPIVLPLGISFFTFHHVMYLMDLRRGRIALCPLNRYALYICFFPQLIAGPLARGRQVLHQFGHNLFEPGWERRWVEGLIFIILGLLQKVFLADGMARLIGPVFEAARAGPVTDGSAWLALAFGFQVFFDFSGYSDIAVGLALLLGVALPQNFNAPYRARGIQDFWTRWHITLTLFLRDYLFVPLCDLRVAGRRRVVAAIIVTMTLCGLWHGAGWTFVLWGVLHGLALALALVWPRFGPPVPRLASRALTVAFVLATAILFGTDSLAVVGHIVAGLVHAPTPHLIQHARIIAMAAALAFVLPSSRALGEWLMALPARATAAAFALCFVVLLVQLGSAETYEFVYFKF